VGSFEYRRTRIVKKETNAAAEAWRAQLGALGEFIRAQRRLADLSLREMAAITSVSNAYLSQVERGLHQPSLKVLRAIAEALGISSQELLKQAGFAQSDIDEATGMRSAAGDNGDGAGARPEFNDTEAAVLADRRLTNEQKAALIGVYRSFLGEGGAGSG
jgi:transcriptional regulator with XRE-family HTH domain